MSYQPFSDLFPDIAAVETRSCTVLPGDENGIPSGHYIFHELYCDEPGCDCRRVMFFVESSPTGRQEAVIAWGWMKPGFYKKWMGTSNPSMIKQLVGPALNDGSAQGEYAALFIPMLEQAFIKDKEFIPGIKRHYRMFREAVDPKAARKAKFRK